MTREYGPLFNYYSKSWRFILISTLLLATIGFIYVVNETPKYNVSIILTANEEDQQSSMNSGLINTLVGGNSRDKFFIHEFRETLYSYDAMQALNNKENTLFKYFGSLYDQEKQNYEEIINLKVIFQKIKFKFYGIDYEYRPNLYVLNAFIEGSISIEYVPASNFIIVSWLTSDPKLAQSTIEALLTETDELFKERDKFELDAKIEYLYGELKKNQDVVQINSVSRILQSQLLKKSLVDSGGRYKFKTVRDFETSEYPVYPNFMFIILLFASFGLFGSLAYKTYYFIFKISKA